MRKAIATEVRAEIGRQQKNGREIAGQLGITASVFYLRLNGKRAFRAEELVLLADLLDVPVERFLPAQPQRSPSASAAA